MKKHIPLVVAASVIGLTLQACVPFALGTAAAGASGATYYGHDTFRQMMDDSDVTKEAYRKLSRHPNLVNGNHVVVSVKNGNLLLVGQVTDPSLKSEAENVVRNVDGVRTIYNFITVSGPTADLVRSSDSWITAKIKSELVATKGVHANQIKVVTENGVVYLMGSVSSSEADTAVNVARQIQGVQKVVKLFENQ